MMILYQFGDGVQDNGLMYMGLNQDKIPIYNDVMVTMFKKSLSFWLIFLGVVICLSFLAHPRLRLLIPGIKAQTTNGYYAQFDDGRDLWKARELASVGSFTRFTANGWPVTDLTQTFPALTDLPLIEAVYYDSDELESVDLIVASEVAQQVFRELGKDMPINSAIPFEFAGSRWVVGWFDKTQAAAANGFFDTSIADDIRWLHLTKWR